MSSGTAWPGVAVLVLVLVVLVLVLAVALALRSRRASSAAVTGTGPALTGRAPRAAVVVHAVKVDDRDARRRQIESLSAALGWGDPIWLAPTADDPGRAQARSARGRAPAAELAFGGDGPARMVAEGLSGSGVPMGLLPAGTGNLLARNLGIPPNRLESSLRIALTGHDRPVDVCWAGFRPDGTAREAFLVMAGLGFDAEMMAGADAALKSRIGWGAYVVSGMRRLRGRRTPVTIRVDDGPPQRLRVRAVVVGNCGMLQAGIRLMPDAVPDDGWLDVVVLSPRSIFGWLALARAVLTRRSHPTVTHLRCRSLEVQAERPLAAQLDGDPAGESAYLRVTLDHHALVVRVPD